MPRPPHGSVTKANRARRRASPCRLKLKRPCWQSRQPGEVLNFVRNAQSRDGYQTWYRRQKKSSSVSRWEEPLAGYGKREHAGRVAGIETVGRQHIGSEQLDHLLRRQLGDEWRGKIRKRGGAWARGEVGTFGDVRTRAEPMRSA